MSFFSEASIREVREAIDLVELAETYTRLKKSGSEWKGTCPLPGHEDKSPSFYVNESEGVWHCFGCNRDGHSGDGIGLIEAVESVGFRGAVRIAAEKFGVSLEAGAGGEAESTYRVRRALKMAEACFQEVGEASGCVEAFLQKRQLNPDTVEAFGVGYAPGEWNAVETRLLEDGVTPEDLVRAGLVANGERGRYGVFRDRIMFPIRNVSGQVIGFGGRRRGKQGPKYINTAETVVYQKKRALFGLWASRKAIRAQKAVFVVEGYTDALRLWDCGVRNVVASCGTSLTVEQVKSIPREAAQVVTCFDGDAAGQKATAKGLRTVLCAGREEGAVVLPEGEDPDSFGRGHDETSLRSALQRREERFVSYTVRRRLQPQKGEGSQGHEAQGDRQTGHRMRDLGPVGRLALRDDLIAGLVGIPSLRRAREYVRQCAWELGLEGRKLLKELESLRRREGLAEETETDDERDRRVRAWERYWERHGENVRRGGEGTAGSEEADRNQGRQDETAEGRTAEGAPTEGRPAPRTPSGSTASGSTTSGSTTSGSTTSGKSFSVVPEEWLQGSDNTTRPGRDEAGGSNSQSEGSTSLQGGEKNRGTDVRSLIQAVVEGSETGDQP